jgi:hypothetical protein
VESLRDLIELYDREIAMLEPEIHRWLRDDAGYRAIQSIHGVGRTMAAIFVAEIGDVQRFSTARHLCSWAGLTPKHIESDTKVIRGRITRMGSALVRWAATEAVARYHGGPAIGPAYRRIAERRGTKIAGLAAPARFSPSSSTACAMAASAASRRRGDGPAQPSHELDERRDPHHPGGVVVDLYQPAWCWPQRFMLPRRRRDARHRTSGCPTHFRGTETNQHEPHPSN